MRRWLFGLFICSLVLRVASLGVDLLWYDEQFTAYLAKLPFMQMLAAVHGDVHPPLWYAIEWSFAQLLGRSEFVMRLPAALLGTGAVMESYQLVRRVGGEKAARWASGLMAVMPAQLYYSQEARMYTLLTLLVLLAARAVIEHKWLRLAACLALLGYSHNLGLVYSALLGSWALWESKLKALRTMILGGAAYLPWGFVAIQQSANLAGGFWIPPRDLAGILYFIPFTTIFTRMPEWLAIHAITLSIALTLISLFLLHAELKRLLPLIVLAFGPSAILFIVSQVWHPVLLDRALIPAGAVLIGLWGLGISKMTGWSKKLAAAVAIPMLLAAVVTYYVDPIHQRDTQDPVIGIIDQGWQPGDALYHLNISGMIAYDYYLPGKTMFSLPENGDLAQSLTDETKIAMGLKQLELAPEQLKARGYRRIWLFVYESPVTSDLEEAEARTLLTRYPVVQRWTISETKYQSFTLALLTL